MRQGGTEGVTLGEVSEKQYTIYICAGAAGGQYTVRICFLEVEKCLK